MGPHEAPNPPELRSGLRLGAPCLQVDRGGPWGGALTESWRHCKAAGLAPPPFGERVMPAIWIVLDVQVKLLEGVLPQLIQPHEPGLDTGRAPGQVWWGVEGRQEPPT